MEMAEKRLCSYGGEEYSFDEELCMAGECFVCNDGEWENTGIAGV